MSLRPLVLALSAALPALALFAPVPSLCEGADWPQYRGPSRDGIAPPFLPLIDQVPAEGLKKLWQSDEIRAGESAGFGSPAVTLGRVYVYQNLNLPPVHRVLYKQAYDALGYAPDMPADLSKAVEEARTSDERKTLDPRALDPWIKGWLEEHLTADQRKWRGAAQARLKAGANAVPFDLCAKLAPLVNKRFETVEALDAWAKENGLDDAQMKRLRALAVPGEEKTPKDSVYCLDAATGKTFWQTPVSAVWFYYGCSSTPTISGARLYVTSSDARVFCLDAIGGAVIWQSDPLGPAGYHHNRSSSPLVIGNVVVAFSETCLAGIDATTGKVLWKNPKLKNQQSSAATWVASGIPCALVNAGVNLYLVDPKDGRELWAVKCGGVSMPAVSGDVAVVAAGGEIGLAAYRMTAEKAELMWKVPWKDAHSGALIDKGFAYALGGAFGEPGRGKAICVELATGSVKWEQTIGNAQHSSPLLADGKIFAFNGGQLLVIQATPEKYTPLGAANLGIETWSSPALADGKLFVRTGKGIVCYSLVK